MTASNDDATTGTAAWRRSITVRCLVGLTAVAWLVALWVLTARVARVYPVSSDDATGVLEAADVVRGNLLLRGWWLSGASFAAIDLPFYVAGFALSGPEPSLLRNVPVTIYTCAVAAAVLLARGRCHRGGGAVLGVAAALVLLGLPAGGWAEFATKGYIRVGTTLGLFLALVALDAPPGRRASSTRVGSFALLLTLTILSDPYALYVGVPAILVVCLLGVARVNAYETIPVGRVLIAVLAAVAAAKGLSWLIEAIGGYKVYPTGLSDSLVRPDQFLGMDQSALMLTAYLPDLYRCAPPEAATWRSLTLWAGCLIGPALLVYALVRGCPISIRSRHMNSGRPADFVADVVWVLVLLAFAAFLMNRTTKDRTTMRYMIPFVLSGAVLTGRVLANRVPAPRTPVAALGLLGLTYAVTVLDDLQKPQLPDPAEALANWLDSRGLRHGYGPFWSASIITASSRGRVAVRPVWVRGVSSKKHRIEPLTWMADQRWFAEGPVTFVIFELGWTAPYQFGVGDSIWIKSFGRWKKRYAAGRYIVLEWDHDLRPFLNRDSG